MYSRKSQKYPLVQDVVLLNSMGSLTFDQHIVDSVDLRVYRRDADIDETFGQYQENGILLLEGGADISPSLYSEANRYSYPSGYRDEWEAKLYQAAHHYSIPIFGICRGHQLMAALNGGSLWQDINRDLQPEQYHGGGPLKLSGIFAEWYPDGYTANSAHHQCVRRVPGNAVVVAVDAKDERIIEALDYPEDAMFSVQFHPEFMDDDKLLGHIVRYLFQKKAQLCKSV
jgi:gamma-glutamyl-gamma-aminobutyrate hydrolase PuuD